MVRTFSKLIALLAFLLLCIFPSFGQVAGKVVDDYNEAVPSARIVVRGTQMVSLSDSEGRFSINAQVGDTLDCISNGFQLATLVVKTNKKALFRLFPLVKELEVVDAMAKRMADFDVGYLPPIKGVQIYSGTNTNIELEKLSGAKSTGNPREIFAKVPGLNIWETDGSGIQIGIGGRGLSPNRTANFNTRQNGYDISADALGYPESYYTPPTEALQSIEIIRGSAALQFGTQFGGLLNFILRDPPLNTNFEFTSRNTLGSFGYFGTFNRVAGTSKRLFYQAYHQYKQGQGYRENSEFKQHQGFAQVGYYLSSSTKIRLEYTRMSYLAKQAGGLSDKQFNEDPTQSLRNRNWFQIKWNLLALHFDSDISRNLVFNFRSFGMLSSRETLGFLGKITQQDPGGEREMLLGQFKNFGAEARVLKKYKLLPKRENAFTNAAFLVGVRFYQGTSTALQGTATDGDSPSFRYRNPKDLEGSNFVYPSKNVAAFLDNVLFLTPKWTMNAGVRLEHIQSASEGFYKQYVIHPINQDTLAIYKNQDSNSVVRTIPLFGLGTSYKLSTRSTIYNNFTQNYRAINFTDIRLTNPNIVIDTAIQDEYGYTAEIGLRGLLGKCFIYDFAGFYVFYGDKIGLTPKPGTIQKVRTNIGDAVNLGVESFMEFDFLKAFIDSTENKFTLFTNVAYIQSKYIRSTEKAFENKQVEYVSPLILRSGVKLSLKKWTIQIQGSYNSAQFSDATNAVEPSGDAVIGLVPAYKVFDCSSSYQFNEALRLELGVNNFTNEKYFTRRATGYPGPGILPSDGLFAYGTLQFKFVNKKKSALN